MRKALTAAVAAAVMVGLGGCGGGGGAAAASQRASTTTMTTSSTTSTTTMSLADARSTFLSISELLAITAANVKSNPSSPQAIKALGIAEKTAAKDLRSHAWPSVAAADVEALAAAASTASDDIQAAVGGDQIATANLNVDSAKQSAALALVLRDLGLPTAE